MFKDVLKKLREENALTQEQLAEILNVSPGTIGNYEQGQRLPKDDKMWIKIATFFKVSVDFLMDVNEQNDMSAPTFTTYKVPILGSIACGEPIYSPESADVYVSVSKGLHADFALIAKGDSMIGEHIFDGDIVLIRTQPEVELGQIAAISINDEVTLKHTYYYPETQKLILQSANPKYEPMVYVGEELNTIRILGKAVAVQHVLN
jgi:repressor LexA